MAKQYAKTNMQLETQRLVLRDLMIGDEKDIVRHLNNLEVSKYLLVVPYPYTLEHANSFIEHCVAEAGKDPRTEFTFVIERKEVPGLMGLIGLAKIDRFQETAEIGYWLSQEYWRKGITSEALEKVIDFAFYEIGLRRLDISAAGVNEGSNGIIKKFGFVYEGTRRQKNRVKSTGKIYDQNIYGLLKGEWKNA